MVRLDIPTLEQISAGLIKVQARQGRLYPYPQDLQLGYDRVVLAFLVGGKALDVPDSIPKFYELCEQPFEEWGVEIDDEIDSSDSLLFLGEPTELTIELAEAFGGSVLSQEQTKIATELLQHCQSHPQGVQIYTKFRRFIIEHPVLSNQEFVKAKGDFGLGVGLSDLLDECYEPVPSCYELEGNFYACPYCHALAGVNPQRQVIANSSCNRCPPGRRLKRKVKLPSDCLKLKRGIERFWFYPGRAEIQLFQKLVDLGLEVELYPECDRYDLRIKFSDGEVWALDLKDYSNPYLLVRNLGDEPIPSEPSWNVAYIVIPAERKKDRPAYLKELKSRWRWENVKPIFDDAVFALAKKKAGVREVEVQASEAGVESDTPPTNSKQSDTNTESDTRSTNSKRGEEKSTKRDKSPTKNKGRKT
ncbi:hypothetical protein [Nostoc sp. 2RC]|uniref:restriction endonuclease-related protein n=1 Tax=Nostoc sp. 2RC TaxID=2485484 RepID=UPI00162876C5|nr:hypothetical protein [Nostoc sp. 2RC]MBC1238676.1 hypothetical protein [Nostoc sp. 2RC]